MHIGCALADGWRSTERKERKLRRQSTAYCLNRHKAELAHAHAPACPLVACPAHPSPSRGYPRGMTQLPFPLQRVPQRHDTAPLPPQPPCPRHTCGCSALAANFSSLLRWYAPRLLPKTTSS